MNNQETNHLTDSFSSEEIEIFNNLVKRVKYLEEEHKYLNEEQKFLLNQIKSLSEEENYPQPKGFFNSEHN